eukprot:Gb_00157 [translate_table: standard]
MRVATFCALGSWFKLYWLSVLFTFINCLVLCTGGEALGARLPVGTVLMSSMLLPVTLPCSLDGAVHVACASFPLLAIGHSETSIWNLSLWCFTVYGVVVGTLRGFDQFMNLVLDGTVEVNGNERNEIGMVVIRGNSVVMIEALEPVNRS